jgi:hypothetical protein
MMIEYESKRRAVHHQGHDPDAEQVKIGEAEDDPRLTSSVSGSVV